MARVTVYAARARAEAREISTEDRVEIAHKAADDARANAPVESGEYRDGIGVRVSGADVAIVDEDPEAEYKEYGTSSTPAHATLTNAASQHGRYTGVRPRGARTRARALRARVRARGAA